MSTPTHAADLLEPIAVVPHLGTGACDRAAIHDVAAHSMAELLLQRLRFYVDLLGAGYHQALSTDPLSHCLRAERIALGIDLPELDAVPLWSSRRRDGTICVPFVEFILGQIIDTLNALLAEVASSDPSTANEIETVRDAVAGALETMGPGGKPSRLLPRLRDVFVPATTLDALCGPGGCLPPLVRLCEGFLRRERRVSAH